MAHRQRGRRVARDQPAAGPPQRAGGQHRCSPSAAASSRTSRSSSPRTRPGRPSPCRTSGWRAAPLERRGLGHTVPMSVPRRVVPLPIPGGHESLRFYDVTSADGTRLRAWTNDADGPTVLLCNGLGTNPYAWPALLRSDCGVRVISWNHRGVGGSDRPVDRNRVDVTAMVEDAVAVLDDAEVDSCPTDRLVDRREHRLRARRRASRPGYLRCSRSPGSPAARSPRWAHRCRSRESRGGRSASPSQPRSSTPAGRSAR